MINTIGLLLNYGKDFHFRPGICVDNIVRNLRHLRKQKSYFPDIKLLSDNKLKIEFCPAKLLYGNNLYEISSDNIPDVLCRLNDMLHNAHIITCPTILLYAHVYRIDYAKVCYLPFDGHILLPYLQEIHQGGHYKQAFTFYSDDGHMAASALKRRKVAFYNKSAEILQDKRNTSELKDLVKNLPGTFYRLECSLKTAKEIGRELSACKVAVKSCTLDMLIQTRVMQTVLQRNLEQSIQHWHVPNQAKALEKIRILLDQKQYPNTRTLLTDLVYLISAIYVGVEDVRQIIEKQLGKRRAREFIKRFEKLTLTDTPCVAVFKEKFMKEVQTLHPLNKTYLDGLTRKELVTDSDTRLFAPVLLAILELLISTPLG